MHIVELNEDRKKDLAALIRSVAIEYVLPDLNVEGKEHYLAKIVPDIDYCLDSEHGKYIGVLNKEKIFGVCGFSTKGHIAQLFVNSPMHAAS